MPWTRDEQDALIAKVAEKTTPSSVSSVGRPKLQNFTTMQNFLPTDVWAHLLSDKLSASSKMETLLTAVVGLALRHPNESTYQVMAGLYLATTEGLSGGMKVAAHLKYGVLQNVKRGWRAMAKPLPPTFVADLPATPELFRQQFPDLYAQAFGKGDPAPCPLDQMHLSSLVASVPMRSRSKLLGAGPLTPMGLQPPLQQDQLAQAMLQAFMATFSADSFRQAQPVLKFFPQKALPVPALPLRPLTPIPGLIAGEAQSGEQEEQAEEMEEVAVDASQSIRLSGPTPSEHLPRTPLKRCATVAEIPEPSTATLKNRPTVAETTRLIRERLTMRAGGKGNKGEEGKDFKQSMGAFRLSHTGCFAGGNSRCRPPTKQQQETKTKKREGQQK